MMENLRHPYRGPVSADPEVQRLKTEVLRKMNFCADKTCTACDSNYLIVENLIEAVGRSLGHAPTGAVQLREGAESLDDEGPPRS